MIATNIPFAPRSKGRVYQVLKNSPLFDSAWYLSQNLDVCSKNLDPITHYINHGHREGRQPNPLFDPVWYISEYPYVKIEPLLHYIKYGSKKGLRPNSLFDPVWYVSNNPDVAKKGIEPLSHYLEHGRREGRRPSPLFEPSWYLSTNSDVATSNQDPLWHYLRSGYKEGRRPNPIFDPKWYLLNNSDVESSQMEPLSHYLYHGVKEGRSIACDVRDPFPTDIYSSEFQNAYRQSLVAHTKEILEKQVLSANGSICYLLPERFSALHRAEGFCQRVLYIDNLLSASSRIYVNIESSGDRFHAPAQIALDTWEFVVYEKNAQSREVFDFLLARAQVIYAHSIYSLQPGWLSESLDKKNGLFIIDAHGVVPEEEQANERYDYASRLQQVEAAYFPAADRIVAVTQSMIEFYSKKYNLPKANFAYVPFLPTFGKSSIDNKPSREGDRIVYCGGSQKWQMLPEMLIAINSQLDNYRFSVISSDTSSILTLVKNLPLSEEFAHRVTIKHLPHPQLIAALHQATFGFVLREDSIVNRVACPTKLIEYMQCEVVPIMNYSEIGDFKELGLCFVAISDFQHGRMPTAEESRHMAGVNLWVLRKMRAMWEEGIQTVYQLVYSREELPALLIDDDLQIHVHL